MLGNYWKPFVPYLHRVKQETGRTQNWNWGTLVVPYHHVPQQEDKDDVRTMPDSQFAHACDMYGWYGTIPYFGNPMLLVPCLQRTASHTNSIYHQFLRLGLRQSAQAQHGQQCRN